ncbi:MAG: carbohydrate-binding domain-containing protein, partial [Oscillospiraceae bacterium]|nr:carbohydrate-binding domain-containing protein [Oscillospiraceae bacterium]
MKQAKRRLTAILLCSLLLLSGCGAQNTAEDTSSTETASSGNITATTVSAIDTSSVFSDRDLAGTYDESEAIPITLNGDGASCDSSSVVIGGSTITITAEGVYLISGALTDGQIIVNAGDTEKVQLVLAGADITSTTSAAI